MHLTEACTNEDTYERSSNRLTGANINGLTGTSRYAGAQLVTENCSNGVTEKSSSSERATETYSNEANGTHSKGVTGRCGSSVAGTRSKCNGRKILVFHTNSYLTNVDEKMTAPSFLHRRLIYC